MKKRLARFAIATLQTFAKSHQRVLRLRQFRLTIRESFLQLGIVALRRRFKKVEPQRSRERPFAKPLELSEQNLVCRGVRGSGEPRECVLLRSPAALLQQRGFIRNRAHRCRVICDRIRNQKQSEE